MDRKKQASGASGIPIRERRAAGEKNGTAAGGLTAIVVDNDPAMVELAAGMLRQIGYRVSIADEGAQALFDFHRCPCDLVLTGFEMLAINGYQLGRRIKRQRPATRVLIMTGLRQAAVAGLMIDGHIDGWLFKPFQLEDLKTLLRYGTLLPGQEEAHKSQAATGTKSPEDINQNRGE